MKFNSKVECEIKYFPLQRQIQNLDVKCQIQNFNVEFENQDSNLELRCQIPMLNFGGDITPYFPGVKVKAPLGTTLSSDSTRLDLFISSVIK